VATIFVFGTSFSVPHRPGALAPCGACRWSFDCTASSRRVSGRVFTLALFVSTAAVAQDGLPPAYWQSPLVREGQYVLWHDPGPVETLDFRYGIGGAQLAPKAPFTFDDEDPSGTTPKIQVKDANGRSWSVKFGDEASPDTFCTRMAWAMGYYATPAYYLDEGTIQGVRNLQRARSYIDKHGRFEAARFQLRARDPKFLKTVTWSWEDNPFLKAPEFGGLKILLMLLSDWDNKDARDVERRGTNTAIYQHEKLLYYFIDDWGGSMGKWGKFFTRSKWNADHFLSQSNDFVKLDDGKLEWGYVGQHSSLLKDAVTRDDARWLMQYLGRVTDAQLRAGLSSSGATPEETEKYVRALRMRISALARVSSR
jgi:hypothetical protein